MKRDPSIEQILRGELLARSRLGYPDGRDAMLEALLDLLPAYTQRDGTDPGVALVEALAAVLEIFGFYHDRILTESKVGSAQLLQSVALLGDVVGYIPRPALAAVTHQFFEARNLGVITAGSKLAARATNAPSKVVFETLHALSIGPAFNRMTLDPIVARHMGAFRAVLRRIQESIRERITPLDEFPVGALVMLNGIAGLELTPIAGARSRAIAVTRALRRSYGLRDTRVHCATLYRHLRNRHSLASRTADDKEDLYSRDDLIVFEVSDRPILHIPVPTTTRVRSTLEVFVFEREMLDPSAWPSDQQWQEVPDFSASEASDRHYRTIVDDRQHTYIILRRRLGYRTLLRDDQLDHVYVRFTPAVGDIRPVHPGPAPMSLDKVLVKLDHDYFTSPIVVPRVDGEPVIVDPSHWVVTEKSLGLTPGRQIIIENADTGDKYVRTLGPWTLDQYLNWKYEAWDLNKWTVALPMPIPRPLWDRIDADIIALADENWMKGLFLQNFGHYFPLALPPFVQDPDAAVLPNVSYPVLPGVGAAHGIPDPLLFVEDIFQRQDRVPGWTERTALSISPLRNAAKAGPYHLWDEWYRHFENLDWSLLETGAELLEFLQPAPPPSEEEPEETEAGEQAESEGEEPPPADPPAPDPEASKQFEELKAVWQEAVGDDPANLRSVVVVPRGATFFIVADSTLIRPGDHFLLGKRLRYYLSPDATVSPEPVNPDDIAVAPIKAFALLPDDLLSRDARAEDEPAPERPVETYDPHWIRAEVLQAVEVHGRIVRLKWPTQNQYDVDFQMNGDGAIVQPVTELIVVPQVASVFYGETFSQEVTLSPSRVKILIQEIPETKPISLIPVKPSFGRIAVRQATGWHNLKKTQAFFESDWSDIFLISFVDGTPYTVVASPDVAAPGLVWRVHVLLSKAALENLTFSQVLLAGPAIDGSALKSKFDVVGPVNDADSPETVKREVRFLPLKTALEALAPPFGCVWVLPKQAHLFITVHFKKFDVETMVKDPQAKFAQAIVDGTLVRVTKPALGYGTIVDLGQDRFKIEKPTKDGFHPDVDQFELVAVNATPNSFLAALELDPEGFGSPRVFVPESAWSGGTASSKDLVAAAIYPNPHIERHRAPQSPSAPEYQPFIDLLGEIDAKQFPEDRYRGFINRAGQLDKARYKTIGSEQLADDENFLYSYGRVHYLMVTGSGLKPGPYALFSKAKAAESGKLTDIGTDGDLGQKATVKLQLLTDSIIFNSGNFIPVRMGNNNVDHQIVANSLRIRLDVVNEGFEISHKQVNYEEDLVTILANMSTDKDDPLGYEERNLFGFGKTPEGVFTLNFLFYGYFPESVESAKIVIDVIYTAEPYHAEKYDDPEEPYVHWASYAICKDVAPVWWRESRYYQFETRPLPWNPLRQLVILNTGELKAGDYLFIDPSGREQQHDTPCNHPQPPAAVTDVEADEVAQARDYIQWTRVVEVDGRMVMVDPHVKIQPRGFYHYRVTGYRRPATAVLPSEDYYALLESEHDTESDAENGLEDEVGLAIPDEKRPLAKLSFRDRLMLRPFEPVKGSDDGTLAPIERTWLLDNLVPGDRLLVWDERWRSSWASHRISGSVADGHRWWAWPDHHHEVVIKRIVPRLGIVELEQRMPTRFGVDYDKEGYKPDETTDQSIQSFSALPFYREPFQGRRELLAIGDGDRRVKFPRFTSHLDAALGLGTLALDESGTVASNIEVLTFDASDGAWTRWTEFTAIDRAKRKDRAFVLGLETPEAPVQADCPNALFPDDVAAVAEEDCCCPPPKPPTEGGIHGPGDIQGTPPAIPRIHLSVSFGDGVNGDLLPNGKANVLIRPVAIGAWCRHFLKRPERPLLAYRQACMPFRIDAHLASAMNLALLVEHGAHRHWRSRAGEGSWVSSIAVEIGLKSYVDKGMLPEPVMAELAALDLVDPGDWKLILHEVSDDEARDGHDGVILRPVRPGVVELFIALRRDLYVLLVQQAGLTDEAIRQAIHVHEELQVEQWRLDENFYEVILARDPSLKAGSGALLLGETEGLAERSLLAFARSEEESDDIEIAEVAAVDHATFSATLSRGLARMYSLERSYLFGNVVAAVQGNSERQILGSGDGVTRNLRLGLGNREPILHSTMQPGSVGELTPGVTVLVDDIPWDRVDTFEGRGPRDRVYCLEIEASGRAYVRFGDGNLGSVPAAGLDNIVAVVRTGDGGRGNVPVGAVDRLLDGNLAVERTRNVTPGGGGKAADDAAQAREHLMTRSFTHGRIVTHDDVLRAVLALGNVVQARLDPLAPAGLIRVIVALAERQPAARFVVEEMQARLLAVMPVATGVSVELVDAASRPVHVLLEVSINRGYFEGEVIQALERAFSAGPDGFFDLARWPIGGPLRVGEIFEHAFALPGVATARVRWLSTDVEPLDLPVKVPDILWPAPHEVIRCDSDRVGDPYRARGNFRVQVKRGGK